MFYSSFTCFYTLGLTIMSDYMKGPELVDSVLEVFFKSITVKCILGLNALMSHYTHYTVAS